MVSCGISHPFEWLSRTRGYVIHVLLTRSPLTRGPKSVRALDLHVLSTPPAFVLSQDQTLQFDSKNSLLLNDWVLVIGPKLFSEANSSNGCFFLVGCPFPRFRRTSGRSSVEVSVRLPLLAPGRPPCPSTRYVHVELLFRVAPERLASSRFLFTCQRCAVSRTCVSLPDAGQRLCRPSFPLSMRISNLFSKFSEPPKRPRRAESSYELR